MKWHYFTSAAFVLAIVGCATDGTTPIEPGRAAAFLQKTPPPTEVRSQQPEVELAVARPMNIEGELAVRARALVNGMPILDDELKQAAFQQLMMTERMPEPERTEARGKIVRGELDKLIERELILADVMAKLGKRPQAIDKLREAATKEFEKQVRAMKQRAKDQGFPCDSDEQFNALLEQQGLTLDTMQRQAERSFMAMEYMRHRIYGIIEKISHQMIRQYYDEHPGEFQSEDRVKWQDIFIATSKYPSAADAKRKADDLAARASKGEDFAELSKKFDDGDSGIYRNGAGLGQKHGEIRPTEVESILFRMREGEVGPIVETFNGYHVIRLQEREYAGLHPFDEKTQQDIKKKLQGIIADREYKRIIGELKRKATVQIVEE
jgi:parvulin-like peptidyl-prolyl isomerase